MAKHFNNGVIVYDAQVELLDMVALPAENIEFPQGVMKKLDYFGDEVIYAFEGYTVETVLTPGEKQKIARMGAIQAVGDFAKSVQEGAEQGRIGLANQAAADKAELEGKIQDEEDRATLAEAGLQSSINQNAADIVAENTAMLAAVAAQNTAMLAAVAVVQADADQNESDADAAIAQANADRLAGDNALGDALDAESLRATTKENEILAALNAEAASTDGDLAALDAAYKAADAVVKGQAESYADAAVLVEKTRAESSEGDLLTAINAEAATARSAEQLNAAAIVTEKDRAELAESNLADAVQLEEDRATLAESDLQGKIDIEKGRIDAILTASTADADSFKEIVDIINAVDTQNDQAFASHVLDFNAAKAALEQADSDEQAARIAAVSGVQSSLDAYVASNDAALLAEKTERENEDIAITTALGNEIASTTSRFASATTDRGAIRSEVSAAVSAAEAAAEAANVALKGELESYADAGDAAEATARAAAIAGVQAQITSNDGELATINGSGEGSIAKAKADAMDHADAKALEEKGLREAAIAQANADRVSGDAATLTSAQSYTDGEISSLESAVEAAANAETAVREGEEARIEGKHDAYVLSNDAALAQAIADSNAADLVNSNAISAESQTARGEEQRIEGKFDGLVAGINTAAATESAARIAEEARIEGKHDAYVVSNNAAMATAATERGNLADAIQAEEDRALAAEAQGLADAKAYTDAEITALDNAFTSALDAEILATNADIASAEAARIAMNTQLTADIATAKGEAIAHTDAAVAALVDSSPAALDTLNELAQALGDDENFSATVTQNIATAKAELELQVDAVEAALASHGSENVTEFAAVRAEQVAGDAATLASAQAYADQAEADAKAHAEAEDLAMKTALEADIADLEQADADEIAARVAQGLALTAGYEAADAAIDAAYKAADAQLTSDLGVEVARASAKENQIEAKQGDMFDGEVSVAFTSNAVASAALVLAGGFEYHIVQNSGASAAAELPVLGPNFKVTVTLAGESTEPMSFSAPAGMSMSGEPDGVITMYPGSSVTFVEHGGVYYMM